MVEAKQTVCVNLAQPSGECQTNVNANVSAGNDPLVSVVVGPERSGMAFR